MSPLPCLSQISALQRHGRGNLQVNWCFLIHPGIKHDAISLGHRESSMGRCPGPFLGDLDALDSVDDKEVIEKTGQWVGAFLKGLKRW